MSGRRSAGSWPPARTPDNSELPAPATLEDAAAEEPRGRGAEERDTDGLSFAPLLPCTSAPLFVYSDP
jgi:hypothetical protein